MKTYDHVYHGKKPSSRKLFHRKSTDTKEDSIKVIHQLMQFSICNKEKHSNTAQSWNMADPALYRICSFSLCNVQQIQNLVSFDFVGDSFPSHGRCNKHHCSSQKSTFSNGVCHRHDETCNVLNIMKVNSCFYHPTRRFLNTIDIFIAVSDANLFCYFCNEFSQVENEKQEESDFAALMKK